jgi:predicted acylesterase/phospholipase RssA
MSFSSGGLHGFAFFGVIDALEDILGDAYEAWCSDLRGVAGCSAGAMAALVLTLQLDRATRTAMFRRHLRVLPTPDIDQAIRHYGLFSMHHIRSLTHDVLTNAGFHHDLTLKELHRYTRRDLVFVASNVSRSCVEHMTHHTHPSVRVVDALCASSAVPMLFRPVVVDGDHFVDGCVTEPVPRVFDDASTVRIFVDGPTTPLGEAPSWRQYAEALMSVISRTRERPADVIPIRCTGPVMDVEVQQEYIEEMWREGYVTTMEWVDDVPFTSTLALCVACYLRCHSRLRSGFPQQADLSQQHGHAEHQSCQ